MWQKGRSVCSRQQPPDWARNRRRQGLPRWAKTGLRANRARVWPRCFFHSLRTWWSLSLRRQRWYPSGWARARRPSRSFSSYWWTPWWAFCRNTAPKRRWRRWRSFLRPRRACGAAAKRGRWAPALWCRAMYCCLKRATRLRQTGVCRPRCAFRATNQCWRVKACRCKSRRAMPYAWAASSRAGAANAL